MLAVLTIIMYIALFIYLFFFIKYTVNTVYKLHHNKKENMYEENNFRVFSYYKYFSYGAMFLIFLYSIFVSSQWVLKGWIAIFYILFFLSLLFVRKNISLVDHLLNIMYVRNSLEKIDKECLFGAIVKENNKYYFTYRLTRDKFYI